MRGLRDRLTWPRRIAAAAGVIYLTLFAWTGHLIGRAEASYRNGWFDEGHALLARASFWNVRRGRVSDALGVIDLARGRLDEAQIHLQGVRGRWFHPSAFKEERVLLTFLRAGQFEEARIYGAHRLRVEGGPGVEFYLGVAEKGLGHVDEAERHLAAAEAPGARWREQASAQRSRLARLKTAGRAEFLLDRKGAAVAEVDLGTGRPAALIPGLSWLLTGPHAARVGTRDRGIQVELTLDLGLQKAAEAALGSRQGALVILDASTGALLAAASREGAVRATGDGSAAFSRGYEPGSIIKMITLTAALRNRVDPAAIFPMDCPGWIPLDGAAFRDWTTHRRVDSIDQAVAESCNIAFGRLGGLVGREALDAELRRFGFGREDQAAASDFHFELGRFLPPDAARPSFALARRAEGLDSLRITPIHAAMIAAGLASGGAVPVPYLVQRKRNILDEIVYEHRPSRLDDETLPPAVAAIITRTMIAAVTSQMGTARRASVDGLTAAIKTGTSGTNPPGLDALVIGFAPAERPAIAWALVAQSAGKAELEGARITRELLSRVKASLKM